MITLVALVCHTLSGGSFPVCHEEIVARADTMMECQTGSQPVIADWKGKSRFSSDDWVIMKISCMPGNYLPKDAI